MLNIPLEADHSAVMAVMDTIVAGDFVYKSSIIPTTKESSISGMIATVMVIKSDLLMLGIN